VTDNGNLVLDCAFGEIDDPAGLAADLSALPGVVEHGLFVDLADEIHVGTDEGVTVEELDP
jgi:ribose 5-phosphate isomerase A